MSTRSRIGIVNSDGTITSIYCHFDGYPSGVGATLVEHWTDPDKVKALIALGDISSLREEVGGSWSDEKVRQAMDADPRSKWTLAYGRDRGEEGTEAMVHAGMQKYLADGFNCGAEYIYLYSKGFWACFDDALNVVELDAAEA
jgi:predicted CxxxxCH...CXXCH cytochrome family protein